MSWIFVHVFPCKLSSKLTDEDESVELCRLDVIAFDKLFANVLVYWTEYVQQLLR